jgi:outer membrane protein OmpA-like peptidoglycan-associated protein
MKNLRYTIFIFIISTQLFTAQNLKRANSLFERRSYLNAAELYENEDPKTQEIYEKLGDCYYFNSDMKQAAFHYKTLINNYATNIKPTYYFRYAQALKGINNFNEADIWLQKYYETNKVTASENKGTLAFFESLNKTIKRPYIVQKTNSNSTGSDFGPSFYGDSIVFASTRNESAQIYDWNNQPYLDLYQASINNNGDLINAKPFSEDINTKMHESNAAFTKDGKTMYFTRNNSKVGILKNVIKEKDAQKISQLKIYKAEKVDGKWTNITELPFNADNYSTEHPALSANEKLLYFASDMPGSIGLFDLFVVEIEENGNYGTPKNLGPTINTEFREQFPYISSNNTLYFASDGHLGMGGLDIFKSEISNDTFSKPINLSNVINSNLDDFGLIINEEKEVGYFSSNRANGIGNDDIYGFIQLKKYLVEGLVQNKNTLAPLPGAKVTLFDKNNQVIAEMYAEDDASYSFEIEKNSQYKLRATHKLYSPHEVPFTTDNEGNINKNILLQLELYQDTEENIVVENNKTQIKIAPIYFDFNKWNIRKDAALELNNVVAILKKYPEMEIEIGAHTDCRGTEKYNLILSNKRANSVKNYLTSQGIETERVKFVGYGESQPLNNCTKPGMCEESEYDINRRCEFVILN